jgi:glycosyltransferase involved in cell wall biosynthesis
MVLPDVPLLEGGATGRYLVGLLRGLSANGVDVRPIAARRPFTPAGDVPADLSVEIVDVDPQSTWRARAQRVVRPMGELSWGVFANRIDEATSTADVMHLETTGVAWTDRRRQLPATVHFHYLAHLDRSYGWPWTTQFWKVTEETMAERALARGHTYLVASSPVVAATLRTRAPRSNVVLAPLCLAPDHYRTAPVEGQTRAGFIGTAAWPPTAGALGRLVTRIWPDVRRAVPDAELAVAGRGMRRLVPSAPAGVHVLDEIPSGSEFIHRLGLLLYPVERGSGMKVKVLEALASGVPVVTTRAGAEGVVPNPGVVVVDDDDAIVRATVSLLQDGSERAERGDAALRTFCAHYTPAVATRPLKDLYAVLAAGA